MGQALQNILIAILLAAIPVITKELSDFLKAKSKEAKNQNKLQELNKYIDYAAAIVIDVVNSVSQTMVDSLKKEGAFTKEKQKEAFEKAKQEILSILTEESKSILSAAYGDLDKWLDNKIEATVKAEKVDFITIR